MIKAGTTNFNSKLLFSTDLENISQTEDIIYEICGTNPELEVRSINEIIFAALVAFALGYSVLAIRYCERRTLAEYVRGRFVKYLSRSFICLSGKKSVRRDKVNDIQRRICYI
ncbi:MAG: hypothetical protein K2O16_07230 [Lachnospiraceae bacterium]|nr:hypothetical protein [Lachnospiraceae bacterium]